MSLNTHAAAQVELATDLMSSMGEVRRNRTEFLNRIESYCLTNGRNDEVKTEITNLIDRTVCSGLTQRPEGRVLAIVGGSGAGKTWAIEDALNSITGVDQEQILRVTAPNPPCTPKQLGRNILTEMNFPVGGDPREHIVWEKVRAQVRASKKVAMWIDEMQHATSTPRKADLGGLNDACKNMVQRRDWPLALILSGMQELAEFIGMDRQLERRTRIIAFKPISCRGKLIRYLVTSIIQEHARMTAVEGLLSKEFFLRLGAGANFEFGSVIELTRGAVMCAFDRAGPEAQVTIEDFARHYAVNPRRATVVNVFNASNWDQFLAVEPKRDDFMADGDTNLVSGWAQKEGK